MILKGVDTMKRRLIFLTIAVMIAAMSVALLIAVAGAAQEETSRVRLAHAVPGSLKVDVEVDGTQIYTDVAYKDVTVYTELPAGTHTVTARAGFLTLEETVYLTGGIDATVVGVGAGFNIEAIALQDDNRLANADTVRVVHLSPPDVGAMDVSLTGTVGTATVSALPYKEASSYLGGLGAGEVAIEVHIGGAAKTVVPPTATLQSNAIHTLFIMGTGDTLDLVATVDEQFEEPKYKAFLPLVTKADAGS
jgi:hypothetical protein